MIDGIDPLAQHGADIVVAADMAGEDVGGLQRPQCRSIEQTPRGLVAGHHGLHVGLLAEEIRIDQRRVHRIRTPELDAAAAFRAQQADMAGEAGAPSRLAAMIVDHRHAEMQLDIRHIEIGPGFEEAAAFGDVRRHRAPPLPAVLADPLEDAPDAAERQPGEVRIVGRVAEHEVRMILQIPADARQVMAHGNAVPRQRRAVADPRQHQQLRGLERAEAEDHLAPGTHLADLASAPIRHADRASAIKEQARGMGRGLDLQILAAVHERMNVAARCAPALAVLLGDLIDAEAFLLLAVEIVADPELGFARRLQINVPHRIVGAQSGDAERTAPVSYTHLDVYKRQARQRRPRWHRRRHSPRSGANRSAAG